MNVYIVMCDSSPLIAFTSETEAGEYYNNNNVSDGVLKIPLIVSADEATTCIRSEKNLLPGLD